MKTWARTIPGFTIVELLIVIVVIAIIAIAAVVGYGGVQKRAASAQTMSAAKDAAGAVVGQVTKGDGNTSDIMSLPSDYTAPKDISVIYTPRSNKHYSGLSNVQNGVLFYDICKQLIEDPYYSTIHARDGSDSSSVVMSCDDNIQAGRIQITGWDTRTWTTPVSQSQITNYMNSIPYDNWWTDKQDVMRSFYTALMSLYTSSGGSWPMTSFWDPWANQWSGVQKQALPAPDSSTGSANFCITATHRKYSDVSYIVTADNLSPRNGTC